jgi:uncharacterized protein YqfB (UPF0267 family)
MTVLTFLPRFAPKVKAGEKLRTIRGERKRPIKVGDKLSLRMWSARPYNSPQIILRESVCMKVTRVELHQNQVTIGEGASLHALTAPVNLNNFARLDGFADWADMVAHFNTARGLPFTGVLIEWFA